MEKFQDLVNYYENLVDVLMAEDFPTDEELESALKLKNVYKDKEKIKLCL